MKEALLKKRKCSEWHLPVFLIQLVNKVKLTLFVTGKSLNEDETGAATAATNSEMSLHMELDSDGSTVETLEEEETNWSKSARFG